MRLKSLLAAGVASLAFAVSAQASVSYVAGTYNQSFDTLPNANHNTSLVGIAEWQDDTATPAAFHTSIVGWYLHHDLDPGAEDGFDGFQRLRETGTASTTTGSFYSFGTAPGDTERAFGQIGSGTIANVQGSTADGIYMGVRITNNTGLTIDTFTFGYTGEQWRVAATAGGSEPESLTPQYKVGASTVNEGGYTAAGSAFTSPITGSASGGGLNGNVAANRTTGLGGTVTGLSWAPGTDTFIRWQGFNTAGSDHGIGIDEFSFSATTVPEPAALAVLGLGALGLIARRRRA